MKTLFGTGELHPRFSSSRQRLTVIAVSCLLVSQGALVAEEAAVPGQGAGFSTLVAAEQAVNQAVPYLIDRGQWWIDTKECSSCHRVSTMIWALQDLPKDSDAARAADTARAWIAEELLRPREKDEKPVASSNTEGAAQLLLADARAVVGGIPQGTRSQILDVIAEAQRDDGLWDAGGQLPAQKRPAEETVRASSLWNAAVLLTSSSPEHRIRAEKALQVIDEADLSVSIEIPALRLMIAADSEDSEVMELNRRILLDAQQEDGGWAWVAGDASDSLGTGLALYALSAAGETPVNPSVRRAVDYLVRTQAENGQWRAFGTKKNRRKKATETSNYWGTSWAVIALNSVLQTAGESAAP